MELEMLVFFKTARKSKCLHLDLLVFILINQPQFNSVLFFRLKAKNVCIF